MSKVSGKLTVFFEVPFWVGVFERVSNGSLSVCKVTFGVEPKNIVWLWQLMYKEASRNPKRVQREVRKQVQNVGIGTKSQKALKL